MNPKKLSWLCLFVSAVVSSAIAGESTMPYVLMDEDLTELKSDFNDAADRVRLVFIVGPT